MQKYFTKIVHISGSSGGVEKGWKLKTLENDLIEYNITVAVVFSLSLAENKFTRAK